MHLDPSVFGGVVVGMTSVGSGSLMVVALLFLYPRLRANELVGTDLTQAVPLTLASAGGALGCGHVRARRQLSLPSAPQRSRMRAGGAMDSRSRHRRQRQSRDSGGGAAEALPPGPVSPAGPQKQTPRPAVHVM